ncbi:MAG: hypothetical protein M3Z20_02110 [Chloroflexota bacterium]|nr:hypothetical protein [Chloroflexota bacterium]
MAPRKAASTEWPRLDLPKHRIQSLAMMWTTELEDFADADYGIDLFEDLIEEGMYSALVRYKRGGVNLRCVQVALPRFEGGYEVHVQYERDPDWLPLTMTNDKPGVEAFAALARDIDDASSAECRVELFYPADGGYETVVHLPFELGPPTPAPWPIGAVIGLRGIGVNPDNPDQPTCRFTLERDTEANVVLLLEFTVHLPPTPEAATTVLKQAAVLSEHYVRPAPR